MPEETNRIVLTRSEIPGLPVIVKVGLLCYSIKMASEKLAKRVYLTDAENAELEKRLAQQKISASNYFRVLAGFAPLEHGKGRLKNKSRKEKIVGLPS